jgi:hypothetical protein
MFIDLITNWVLIIPLCAWIFAQLIKMLVAVSQGKGLDLSIIVSSGGMPSSHSAMVCALATAVAMTNGFGSTYFAISVILASIVMYDAAGVRQSVGIQSVVLNRIITELKRTDGTHPLRGASRSIIGNSIGVGLAFSCKVIVHIILSNIRQISIILQRFYIIDICFNPL